MERDIEVDCYGVLIISVIIGELVLVLQNISTGDVEIYSLALSHSLTNSSPYIYPSYSRQKRILFLATWARKKAFGHSPQITGTNPLPIASSSSFGASGGGSRASFSGGAKPFMQGMGNAKQMGMLPIMTKSGQTEANSNSLDAIASDFVSSLDAQSSTSALHLQNAGGSFTNPITIRGSPAPSSELNTTTTTNPLATGSPIRMPSRSPATGVQRRQKLRRERSESVASNRSAGGPGGNTTGTELSAGLAGFKGRTTATRSSKRLKV